MADLNEKLSAYGIDYAEAMERLDGNADFYKQLAMKYLDNDQCESLVAAMGAEDYDEANKAAHALKGVAGNLSFANLFKAATAVNNALSQGEYQAAAELLPDVTDANDKVLAGLEAWNNGEI